MEAEMVVELIRSIGFPAAMCCALFWYMYQQSIQHKAETDKLSEALNANTAVMQRLLGRLGGGDDL